MKLCPLIKKDCAQSECMWWFDGLKECAIVLGAAAAYETNDDVDRFMRGEGKKP